MDRRNVLIKLNTVQYIKEINQSIYTKSKISKMKNDTEIMISLSKF